MPRQPRTRLIKKPSKERNELTLETLQEELHNLREQHKRVLDRLARIEMRLGYHDDPLPMEGVFLLGWFRRLEEARCPLGTEECLWLSQSLLRLRRPHVLVLDSLGIEERTLARVCEQVLSYMASQSAEHSYLDHPILRSVGLWIHGAECWVRSLFQTAPELSFTEFATQALGVSSSPRTPVLRTKK